MTARDWLRSLTGSSTFIRDSRPSAAFDARMRLRSTGLRRFVCATLLALACSDPTGPRSDILRVDRRPAGLEFRNLTAVPVYWIAVETELLPFSLLALCTDAATCASLSAHEARLVPFDELWCCEGEVRHLTILHYHLVPAAGGGFRPDSVRSLGVEP